MKKNKLYLLLLLLSVVGFVEVQAQSKAKISGIVIDKNSMPLESVTIALLHAKDSSFITGVITNEDGKFTIADVQPQQYILRFSMLGYNDVRQSIRVVGNCLLDTIRMEENSLWLSEVVVTGQHATMKMKAGTTTFNVSSTSLNSLDNVLNVLRNLPGVIVNEDGTVIMNGQEGTRILVNGKSTYISGEQLMNYLRSMPVSAIKDIELVTSPSAKYDASGKAGLINIQTQKAHDVGWAMQTNVGYQQSNDGKWNVGNRITYRKNRLGLFVDYSHNQGRYKSTLDINRATFFKNKTEQNILFVDQTSHMKDRIQSDWMRVGLDYDINKKLSLEVSSSFNYFRKQTPGDTYSYFKTSDTPIDSILQTRSRANMKQRVFSGGGCLNYNDENKLMMNLSFDYLLHAHDQDVFMYNEMSHLNESMKDRDTLRGDLNADIKMYAVSGDLVKPIGNKWKLQAGLKYTQIKIDNSALYVNERIGHEEVNYDLSAAYDYNEHLSAAYMQIDGHMERFSINGGLRLEHTRIDGIHYSSDVAVSDVSYKDSYCQLFPFFSVQYQFPQTDNSISLLYNKRIVRPNFRDLSPFNYIWDEYTRSTGNPNLKPELADNFEISYIYKRKYRASLFYSYTSKSIMQNIKLLDNNIAVIYPENFKNNQRVGVKVDAADMLLCYWWRVNANATLFYNLYKWEEFGQSQQLDLFSPSISINNRYSLPRGWNGELNGFYNGRMAFGQATVNPSWSLSLALQKHFMDGRLSLRIYFNDIFQSNRQDLDMSFVGNRGTGKTKQFNDYRSVGISLIFNINKGKESKKNVRDASIDQSKRINL